MNVSARRMLIIAAAGVLALGACSSKKSSSKSSTTTTTAAEAGGTGPDITSFTVPANVDCNVGRIDVAWTTRDTQAVALFVDSVQVASGPYGKGSDTIAVPCDGKSHRIAIEAVGNNGQRVSDAKETKTTPAPSTSTTPTASTTPNPTSCVSLSTMSSMISEFTKRTGNSGIIARSAQCDGSYDVVTFQTDAAGSTGKALFTVSGSKATLVGAPNVGNTPTYVYQNCQLDPKALQTLALPALVSTGGKGVQNCGPTAWN